MFKLKRKEVRKIGHEIVRARANVKTTLYKILPYVGWFGFGLVYRSWASLLETANFVKA